MLAGDGAAQTSTVSQTPAEVCGYPIVQSLTPRQSYLVLGPAGRGLVIKRLDDDCLLHGTLHPSIRERLLRVRELAHGGVANLHGVAREQNDAYLIWEYLQGKTFDEYLAEPQRNERDLLNLARELILSVEALHRQGIVHGALVSGNVIVAPNGAVRLTHISPLLFGDMQVDVESVRALLQDAVAAHGNQNSALAELLAQVQHDQAGLRNLGAKIASLLEAGPKNAEPVVEREERGIRRRSLITAAIVAIVGLALGYGAWRIMDGSVDVRGAFHWNQNLDANK